MWKNSNELMDYARKELKRVIEKKEMEVEIVLSDSFPDDTTEVQKYCEYLEMKSITERLRTEFREYNIKSIVASKGKLKSIITFSKEPCVLSYPLVWKLMLQKKEQKVTSSSDFEVTVDEGSFFAKMFIEQKLKTSSYLKDVYDTIEIATRLNSISESKIEDVHIEKIKEDRAKVTIEYRKVSVSDLTESEDMKDKIIAVLKYLGYSGDEIKSVSEINSLTWQVVIRDTYDPDESFSKRDEETSLENLLNKIFKKNIIIVTIA